MAATPEMLEARKQLAAMLTRARDEARIDDIADTAYVAGRNHVNFPQGVSGSTIESCVADAAARFERARLAGVRAKVLAQVLAGADFELAQP